MYVDEITFCSIFFFFSVLKQSKLIQQDIDALNTELMESSLTDLSMLSFFELFHISPIKVCNRDNLS